MMAGQVLNFAIKATNDASATFKKVQGDLADVGDKAVKSSGRLSGMGSALGSVAKIAGGFVLAQGLLQAPAVIGSLASTARDLELQMKKANTVFGDQMGVVQEWANKNAAAMGLTTKAATNLTAGFADLLIPMGFTREQGAKMATEVVGLSGALAEWSGGQKSAAEVADILSKAMLGERDGLKALGIAISEEDVKNRLLRDGKEKLTGAALEQAKAIATQQLIFEKSADAQAAFADGAGSAARKQAEFSARMTELKENIAVGIMPALTTLGEIMVKHVLPAIETVAKTLGGLWKKEWELISPLMAQVGEAIGGVVGWVRDELVPRFQSFVTEVVPRIQEFATTAQVEFAKFPAYYREHIAPTVDLIVGGIRSLVERVKPWMEEMSAKIEAELAKLRPFYDNEVKPALDNIVRAFAAVVQWVADHWPQIERIIKPVMEQAVLLVKTALGIIKEVVSIAMDLIQGDWSGAWNNVKDLLKIAWDGILGTLGNVVELLKGILGGLGKVLGHLAREAGEALIRELSASIENGLGRIGEAVSKIIGKLNPKNWDIPGLSPFEQAFTHAGQIAGTNLAAGMVEGIRAGAPDVIAALQGMTKFSMGTMLPNNQAALRVNAIRAAADLEYGLTEQVANFGSYSADDGSAQRYMDLVAQRDAARATVMNFHFHGTVVSERDVETVVVKALNNAQEHGRL